ncbi:MAG TPA: DMT family transporter [Acidisarcina sp.]
MSRSLRAHLLLLTVALVWGSTFVMVKGALADVSPLLFNLLRMLVGFLCMALLYRRQFRRVTARSLWSGAIVGFLLTAGFHFQTAGLARTTPSKSAFITGLLVVLVPLFAAFPALRPAGSAGPRWNAWVAAVLAFTGILLITMPTSPAGQAPGSPGPIPMGDLLTLGCAFAFALHCIALSRASERVPFEQLALLQLGFSVVFMAAGEPMLEHPWVHPSARLVVALGVTGVLATAAAFTIQSWAQQFLAAPHTVLILSLEPVFAALTSFLLLGERLGLRACLGALLVLAAIALTALVPSRMQPVEDEARAATDEVAAL